MLGGGLLFRFKLCLLLLNVLLQRLDLSLRGLELLLPGIHTGLNVWRGLQAGSFELDGVRQQLICGL